MATFPTLTQTGGPLTWAVWGGSITNHEVFAFTLQSAGRNTGALVDDVTVFRNTDIVPAQTSYEMELTAVNEGLRPTAAAITGNFESNGV